MTNTCTWTRKTPDRSWAITGPLAELRTGRVRVLHDGALVYLHVGTPLAFKGNWHAHVITNLMTHDGGTWWPPHWKLNTTLPHLEHAANHPPISLIREN